MISYGGGDSARPGHRRIAVAVIAALALASCGDDTKPSAETLGVRTGAGLFDGELFEEAEAWLGREIAWTVQFTGRQSAQDMNGSGFGLLAAEDADLPEYADRLSLSVTVPLAFGDANARTRDGRDDIEANLLGVVDGEFDDAYRRLAERLVEAGYGDAVLRLGHEFNGAWAPWSSRTNEAAFIAAWRHVHELFREVSPDFRFDWTALRPAWLEWGPAGYPGDEYVDIIGLDIYWRVRDGADAWDGELWERNYLRIMRDHRAFAEQRGKPVSYPEWGLSGADSPEFIEAMHEWLAGLATGGAGGLEYHSLFDSGREFSLDQFPLAEEAFQDLFGEQ